jgi:probable HAF family extracellular repeat protein
MKNELMEGQSISGRHDDPLGVVGEPCGINDAGQIVGLYNPGGYLHGFVLSDGTYTALDVPGAVETIAYGVNDVGQIVGRYTDAAGTVHGFVATPNGP